MDLTCFRGCTLSCLVDLEDIMVDFENSIKTDDSGMCSGETYYTIEELYQAFKDRLCKELVAKNDELLFPAGLEDKGDN